MYEEYTKDSKRSLTVTGAGQRPSHLAPAQLKQRTSTGAQRVKATNMKTRTDHAKPHSVSHRLRREPPPVSKHQPVLPQNQQQQLLHFHRNRRQQLHGSPLQQLLNFLTNRLQHVLVSPCFQLRPKNRPRLMSRFNLLSERWLVRILVLLPACLLDHLVARQQPLHRPHARPFRRSRLSTTRKLPRTEATPE